MQSECVLVESSFFNEFCYLGHHKERLTRARRLGFAQREAFVESFEVIRTRFATVLDFA